MYIYNQSSITLTQPQINILTKDLAFRPTPKHTPIVDLITTTEKAAIAIGTGHRSPQHGGPYP
jgi:hypothetical protein